MDESLNLPSEPPALLVLESVPEVPEWRSVFAKATQAFEQGDVTQAEAAYREVMLAAPEFIEAYAGAAHCARTRGDHAGALVLFENARAMAPDAPWLRLEVASDLRALGHFEAAHAAYLTVLEIEPQNIHARAGLAHCARHRGDRAASLALFEEISSIEPQTGWARLEAAADLRELGRVAEAEAGYRATLALEPGNAYAQIGLGQCARLHNDHAAALACFRAAAVLAPENAWTFIELAGELREQGQTEEAEVIYRELLTREPGNGFAELGLGACARARGAREAALAHFEAAARLVPSEPWPWLEIAKEQREIGDLAAARQTALELLRRLPNELQAMLSLAETERRAGQYETALTAYEKAHLAHPHEAGVLVEMALLERHLGRQAKCDIYLHQALALDPLNIPAVTHQANQLTIVGAISQAYAVFEGAAEGAPNEIIFQIGKMETLSAWGRMSEALTGLQALETTHGPDPRLRALRVNLLRQTGHTHEALHLARASTALAPQNFWLWVARIQTELLIGDGSTIEACLRAIPVTSAQERSKARMFAGAYAESCWRTEEAIRHYTAAEAIYPEDPSIQEELVRSKILVHDLKGAMQHLYKSSRLGAYYRRLKQVSINASQTHFGQILDDYRLDEEMATTLAQLYNLAPAPRVTALRNAVRHNSDSTAAAVALLVALRQGGTMQRRSLPQGSPGQEQVIPRIITQYWDGAKPPPDIMEIMQSWRGLNPDFEVRLFSDKTAREFLMRHFPPPVLHAYQRASQPAQKADVIRLAVLTAQGGVYADADDRCLRPIEDLLAPNAQLVLYQEDHGTLGNNFMAVTPRHPVMTTALAMAVTALNRGDSDIVWLSTGPGLLTRAFVQVLSRRAGEVGLPPGTIVYDRRELYPSIAVHCAAAYKRTDRHWSNASFAAKRRARNSA
jgi:tetratricopeptide (TPR) repeat protein